MSDKANKLQQLEQITNSYQVDENVAKRAIKQIENEMAQKAKAKKKPWLKIAYGCVAFVCVVAIGLAVYFGTLPPSIAYFNDLSVELIDVEDVSQVVQEYNSSVKYFGIEDSADQKAIIKESGKLGYIQQTIFFSSSWDNLLFRAVSLENADFDFETSYSSCEFLYEDSLATVMYSKTLKQDEFGFDKSVIRAKFTYQNHDYFMTIDALGDVEPTAKIAYYVDLLING